MLQGLHDMLTFVEDEGRLRGGVVPDASALVRSALQQGFMLDNSISLASLSAELADKMAQMKANCQNVDAPPPRAKTIRWYQDNLNEPIADKSTVTVLQASYCLAWLKLKGGMTAQALNYLCRMLASGGFVQGSNNIMPRYAFVLIHLHCVYVLVYMRVCFE